MKTIFEEPWWTGGKVEYRDVRNKKDYAAYHIADDKTESFMGWIRKYIVKGLIEKNTS